MIIDPNFQLKNMDGEDLVDKADPKNHVKVTLRRIMVNAVLDPNEKIDGEEKVKRFNLAMAIQKSEADLQLSVDEAKLVKDKIAELYPPLIVGQALAILDPPKKKGKE